MSGEPAPTTDPREQAAKLRQAADVFASTGNFKLALVAYEQAIAQTPDDVTLHRGLRETGLRRTAAGGRPAGLLARWKAWLARDAVASLVLWEHALACDPGNSDLMVKVLRVAERAALPDVVAWMYDVLQASQYK